ncbi:MAG: hypothetical protein SGPRY_008837, partial [Prymnesium sp.]
MWQGASRLIAVPVGVQPAGMLVSGSPNTRLNFSGVASPPTYQSISSPEHYPCAISPPSCALSPPSMQTLTMTMGSSPHGFSMAQQARAFRLRGGRVGADTGISWAQME